MRTQFIARTDGGVSVFGALILFSIILLGGVALDSANAWMHSARLQATADAAAHAAALSLPDTVAAHAVALEIVEANLPVAQFGQTIRAEDVQFGSFDVGSLEFAQAGLGEESMATAVRVVTRRDDSVGGRLPTYLLWLVGVDDWSIQQPAVVTVSTATSSCSGGPFLGALTDFLMVFTEGSDDANWQSSSPGYVGDVAVNGILARERTSGSFSYAGTLYTNDSNAGAWQDIINNNAQTASVQTGQGSRIEGLTADFDAAVAAIRAMPVTPGYEDVSLNGLNGLDTRDGVDTTYVINVTSWTASSVINIWGDAGDTFVMRWDTNPATPALDGQVKFQSGGGINPRGDLMPTNFVHLAGDINASGGGTTPSGLVPYVAGIQNEASSGGFFTGYWLTLGKPSNQ